MAPFGTYGSLLATAKVWLVGPHNYQICTRALLDPGAEVSFITDDLARLTNFPRRRVRVPLSGLGSSAVGAARSVAGVTLRSTVTPSYQLQFEALVLPRLTHPLPSKMMAGLDVDSFAGLTLADRTFHRPESIGLILGVDVYGQVLKEGLHRIPHKSVIAQDTSLGWVVFGTISGTFPRRAVPASTTLHMAITNNDDSELFVLLQKFWEMEDIPAVPHLVSPNDQRCEDHFRDTCTRGVDGRYVLRLPLNSTPPDASDETRRMAMGSLRSMERRFERDSKLALEYRDFMAAYEAMGHMERIPEHETRHHHPWYLPHHAVVQSSSTSYRIRVVFDASRGTRLHGSLNSYLMSGPKLQSDISLIMTNWRRHRFAFTADMVKMFRQIWIHPDDRDLQRILWTPIPGGPPVEYRLSTVTYGTACAPFLAIRTLTQVATDGRDQYPLGSRCLSEETYVDDIFSGADTLSRAEEIRNQLTELLGTAGISLDKWGANNPVLIPEGHRLQQSDCSARLINTEEPIKALGLLWRQNSDSFGLKVQPFDYVTEAPTKRTILSDIARVFDPLGWFVPVTIKAKIMIQDLWILKTDWDESVPNEISTRWREYCSTLPETSRIAIHRWLGVTQNTRCEIHGFADASTRAYAATVYLRTLDDNGEIRVTLLMAKSKVSPVKTITIPNLELSGAALLVRLLKHLRQLDFFKQLQVHAWSDSRVVLDWLRQHPSRWKTFVANRVSYIQTELPNAFWRHVSTKENPADLATRGLTPSMLGSSKLWWHGPTWLSQPTEMWPQQGSTSHTPEPATHVYAAIRAEEPPHQEEPALLLRFSSLTKLIRVTANLFKFRDNCLRKREKKPRIVYLTVAELRKARLAILRMSQATTFSAEIGLLRSGRSVSCHSALCKLSPFLNSEGVLCVGGRLRHADLSSVAKHPPILSKRSNLGQLYIHQAHLLALHGGPSITLSTLRSQAWVIGGPGLVKRHVRGCMQCRRARPHLGTQIMGNLPAARTTPARPFTTTGLDYAGPIQLRATKGRGHKSYKGYIALFICFASKAIHLEAVSDLTTDAFIAAYRRFAGRRGNCRQLYSDNGTNFVGAARELKSMFHAASDFYTDVAAVLANDGTEWSFIPPSAPHFGGLWEAGIKSTKSHLLRVIGSHTLTFEEMSTVLVQIEACLNSRPLVPLTDHPDDLQTLTPANFLIGGTSTLVPDAEPPNVPENQLGRFQLVQRMLHEFWKRWTREYLHHLQERSKWRRVQDNFAVGQLVAIQKENYPPAKWPLGRILKTHPGEDGLVRVATVKTANGILDRAIVKLSALPPDPKPVRTRLPWRAAQSPEVVVNTP